MITFQLEQDEKLFIPFITAGDPSEEITIDLAITLQAAGAHAIELGVPYSDPLADGPVIQRASKRALHHGMNIVKAIELAGQMKKKRCGNSRNSIYVLQSCVTIRHRILFRFTAQKSYFGTLNTRLAV